MIFLCKLLVAFNETPLCEGVADNYIGVVFQDLFGKSVTESYSSLSAICTPAILTVDNLKLVILENATLEVLLCIRCLGTTR